MPGSRATAQAARGGGARGGSGAVLAAAEGAV